MTSDTGTGKYERLLARCRDLEPVPTAGLQPGDANKLRDEVRGRIAAVLPELERETGGA